MADHGIGSEQVANGDVGQQPASQGASSAQGSTSGNDANGNGANGNANGNGDGGGGAGPDGDPPVSRYRQSQYAEAIANPLPELAMVAEPEAVSPVTQHLEMQDDASSTRAVVEPDDIGDFRGSTIVYAGEEPSKWRKYRTPLIVALIIAVIVLVGAVVSVVVSNANKNNSVEASPGIPTTPPKATATSATDSSSMGSTSTATSFPSSVPSQCADSSKFITSVSFMGVKDAPGAGGWETSFYGSAKDSSDCCSYCYKSVSKGCDAWAYMPSSGFAGTACAMIVGWDTGDDKNRTCPSGHGASVYFAADSRNATDVGAAGPCGVVAD